MGTIEVDPYSLGAVKLTLFRDEIELAIGSGFLWQDGKRTAIVTAWHCLTGAHYETRQPISKTGARPNRVEVRLLGENSHTAAKLVVPLRTTDDHPAWVVHPLGSRAVDLAALIALADFPNEIVSRPINSWGDEPQIKINVGSDLFIVGYPLGIERLKLPIWKRASLAIDPAAAIDVDGQRYLIVDTATREGLSGAPVFARREGGFQIEGGGTIFGPGSATRFVGCYTGRLATADPMGAQLGIVWPASYVSELVRRGVREEFD